MIDKARKEILKGMIFLAAYFSYFYFLRGNTLLHSAIKTLWLVLIFLIGWVIWRIFTGSWDPRKWIENKKISQQESGKRMVYVVSYLVVGLLIGIFIAVIVTLILLRMLNY